MSRQATLFLVAIIICLAGLSAAVFFASGTTPAPRTAQARQSTSVPVPTPTPLPPPEPWLRGSTLLTIYGRAFNTAPILGRLGFDASFGDVQRQIIPFVQGIHANNGGKRVLVAIHLIYGLATPCAAARNCLRYLDDTGVNIVRQYIKPAARRGWLVILDDQLGSSTPAAEVQRIIARGYMRYDNVAVALDPEFRSVAGQTTPGIPVGSVSAPELNQAQWELNQYGKRHYSRHQRLMLVHQFQFGMIQKRQLLRENFRLVDPVVIADGFGTPGIKAHVYHDLLSAPFSRRIRWRGIKLFYPNPYEHADHLDNPIMTWQQVFGRAPARDGYQRFFVRPAPSVIVIA